MHDTVPSGSLVDRRAHPIDRRRTPRGGRRACDFAHTAALMLILGFASRAGSAAEAMRFGLDVASAKAAIDRGVPISYGSMWAGAWNQHWGWGGIEAQLRTARETGVVPVIQWWYWGDDISP